MTIQASVLLSKNEFIAELSDGRRIGQADLREMAGALHQAGVQAENAQCEWRAGHRMLTAGQQVALSAEMRRLEKLAEQKRQDAPVRGIALAA
ncbi:MAG: hypothetical protein CVU18_01625 [Betaproteobacteria bacterium HGW-Betaproteobacteria-12]|jgi:hypothetical protein|nr:MAG: hypothetical protein CVU18_01625 [Betaproteobacteria bacterium HGW-Betaproteobacteria-12]